MSFFGFDPTGPKGPRDGQAGQKGFFEHTDPFAEISKARAANTNNDVDAIDFEDTYDGLGDQLEETGDDFNDDTFGTGADSERPAADFDFYGQTAKVSNTINEEQMRFSRQQVTMKPIQSTTTITKGAEVQPARSGYEKYKDPSYIPELQANDDLWGTVPKKAPEIAEVHHRTTSFGGASISRHDSQQRKMMSVEEVEAMMRAEAHEKVTISRQQPYRQTIASRLRHSTQPAQTPQSAQPALPLQPVQPVRPTQPSQSIQSAYSLQQIQQIQSMQSAQFQTQSQTQTIPINRIPQSMPPLSQSYPQAYVQVPANIPQMQGFQSQERPPSSTQVVPQHFPVQQSNDFSASQLPHMLPSQDRQSPVQGLPDTRRFQVPVTHASSATISNQPPYMISHPQQFMQLSEDQRQAYLLEDAKRAKRNHKIFLLSKDNGLMTPQDKNFITRIQLQQLMTATGNTNEQDPDAALNEDFYYFVHNQIQGPRQTPNQPLGHFAQTYLFQTSGRHGPRRHMHGDNHMQRMQQQVQRAVEAAKAKPKSKQLVIEGSLGKISFSNVKTPKPLLNIKRPEMAEVRANSAKRPHPQDASDQHTILKNIEGAYVTLLKMEDHERKMPSPPAEGDIEATECQLRWSKTMDELTNTVWEQLKIMVPITPGSSIPHPFIAFLSYPKGKRAIPRISKFLDQEKRLTMATMVILHLDLLDVVRLGHIQVGRQLPAAVREDIELFSMTIIPSLFNYVSEAPLQVVIGFLGLVLQKTQILKVVFTKIGLDVLTMLISRAEIVKQAGEVSDGDWKQWTDSYDLLFNTIEPVLGGIFPGSVNAADDMYVWSFLAAVGAGASPEQQQRLVIAVKDRVMETIAQSKSLPPDMSVQRLHNVNLFMRALGLDVDLLLA